MITKSAGEILHGAMVKAQVYNVDFLDFHTVTNEMNNAYRQLYTEIAESDSDYYIKTAVFEDNTFTLPDDCFIIKTVSFVNTDGSRSTIDKQPPKEYIPGMYYIQNGVFHYNGDAVRPILIRYVPTPQTITVPRESEDVDIEAGATEWGKMTEKGVFYKVEDQCYYYNFNSLSSEEITEDEYKKTQNKYLGNTVDVDYENQTVTFTDKYGEDQDMTELFVSDMFGDFVNIVFDSPYCMISYEDGHIMVMNGYNKTLWNIKAATGHETLGEVVALKTNDKTLFGCIYIDEEDGYVYRASFVPDTVMNYPSNALFNYMEVIIARLMLSMNNIENEYIMKDLYEQVRQQFYKELRAYRSSVTQVNNRISRRTF